MHFSSGEPFLDERDAEWEQDSSLVPTDLNKLSARNFVIYKFGCFIIKMVSSSCDHTPVTLLLADKVPANPILIRNAYRNSYHYDDLNRILYMRKERMEKVGDFVLVLVHALCHIKTGRSQVQILNCIFWGVSFMLYSEWSVTLC